MESEGVDIHDRQAFLNGNNRLRIWTFINYEYTDKLQITFKFKPKPGPRSEPYTLVSNCESKQEPSFGIVLNTFKDVVTFFLKTYGTEGERFMTFDIDVSIKQIRNNQRYTIVLSVWKGGTHVSRC